MKCTTWEIRREELFGRKLSFCFQNKSNTVFCRLLFQIQGSLQNGLSKLNSSLVVLYIQIIDQHLFNIIYFQQGQMEFIWLSMKMEILKIKILRKLLLRLNKILIYQKYLRKKIIRRNNKSLQCNKKWKSLLL